MAYKIQISSKVPDARAMVKKEHLSNLGFSEKINEIKVVDAYTIDSQLEELHIDKIGKILANPVSQEFSTNYPENFDWAIEVGFLPGVTDNIGNTAKENIRDVLKNEFPENTGVYSSSILFLSGNLSEQDVKKISENLANPLINRVHISNGPQKEIYVPKVKLSSEIRVDEVKVLESSDEDLIAIGKKGILNDDGTRRGPLSLDLEYMKAIKEYFKNKGRNPTDIELESIAQTWSEHCKHTIFADPIDEIEQGLYKTYIKGATNKIRKESKKDFCVSVFTDNAGAIEFDENYLVTDKVETHNSPSALDPFGGAITGIVGVNRDAMGFGLGAKPVINRYGFCFASPKDNSPLYRAENFGNKMLSPRMIMDGVIAGVNSGGNCSGIPTPQGFVFFDEKYKGKPLVFVGTIGLIPRKVGENLSHKKSAQSGDYIVMAGGRVGQDGIHGATFSSEALDSGSPATSVQIGDPITQKKMSDAIIKEARDLQLYNSITDNGAGGLSCSVAEMAKECGGCHVKLDLVPLKYPGLEPWQTWISESQERMTLSIPKEKWNQFYTLMQKRGVEATIIGEFTDSGKCVVEHNGKTIMDLDMDFLHDGLPKKQLKTKPLIVSHEEPKINQETNLTETLLNMLKRENIASFEFISSQYDYEVQGSSVIKPLQGKGRVNGNSTVIKPLLDSNKGVALSQGINPGYSSIDTYHMAGCAIDTAIRNLISIGADPEKIALLDNFCWCSSNEPERLWQLKSAVKACYDYATSYKTPFISGKDSMFNDFKGYDEKNKPIKISVPPTLLISSIAVMEDVRKCVTLDVKFPGDLIYLIGQTKEELGGSEYFAMSGKETGNKVPKVDSEKNKEIYSRFHEAVQQGLISSSQSVGLGGLGVALAKKAIAGKLGMEINLSGENIRDDFLLYSESQGRLLVSINPENKENFEGVMKGCEINLIGKVRDDNKFLINVNKNIIDTNIERIQEAYRETFKGY